MDREEVVGKLPAQSTLAASIDNDKASFAYRLLTIINFFFSFVRRMYNIIGWPFFFFFLFFRGKECLVGLLAVGKCLIRAGGRQRQSPKCTL